MRNIVFLLISLIIAGVTAYYAINYILGSTPPPQEESMLRILVLNNNKSFRDQIRQGDIGTLEWPVEALTEDMIRIPPDRVEQADVDSFIAQYYRFYINIDEVPRGVPLLKNYLTQYRPEELPPPGTQRILSLRVPKERGEVINAQDLDVIFWPVTAITADMAVVNAEQEINSRKNELSGQYMQQDLPAGFPILASAFGPELPEGFELNEQNEVVETGGVGTVTDGGTGGIASGSDGQPCFDAEECADEERGYDLDQRPDVIIFSLQDIGDLAFQEDARIDLFQARPVNLLSARNRNDNANSNGTGQGGQAQVRPNRDFLNQISWSVEETIAVNERLHREEGPRAGPLGVRFYVELDPSEVKHASLARELGQLRIKSSDDENLERFNLFCVQERCYYDRPVSLSAPVVSFNVDGISDFQPLQGFSGEGSSDFFSDPGFDLDSGPVSDIDPLSDPFAADFDEPLADGISAPQQPVFDDDPFAFDSAPALQEEDNLGAGNEPGLEPTPLSP